MSIKTKLTLYISSLFIAAIGNSLLTFQLETYSQEKLKWVNHTNKVIIYTEEYLNSLLNAETGQRGYLLTGDISYLKPYYDSINNKNLKFQNLKELTVDNPVQQERLDKIKKIEKLKFYELEKTIKLKQQNNYDKSLDIVKNNIGKEYMDKIRDIFNSFTHTEMILLEKRKGDFRAHKARITTIITVEIVFFIFLAFITMFFINKNLFSPMKLLLDSTKKMEKDENINISDIVPNDEMGYLLANFFKMYEKVSHRTKTLSHKAHHDELTGLKNRTKLYTEINEVIKNSKKFQNKCAVLFIDLNKFKELNDTLGHDAGDDMLKEVSSRLEGSIRDENTVYRIGGDEFLILIQNIKETSVIEKIVINILKSMEQPVFIKGQTINISLSVGIAVSPDDTENSDELIKYADIAMYLSKKDKNIDYKFFDSSMLKRSNDN